MPDTRAPHVIVGVTGGIAAYKACEVIRRLTEQGVEVTVVPTLAALRFVGEATFAALSGRPVLTDVWTEVQDVPHIALGRRADAVVVVPATADFLARAAQGRTDDLLGAILLTTRAPVIVAPAMHTEMWEHPATRDNVAILRARGTVVLEPAVGRLTGPDSGKGRLPDPSGIAELVLQALRRETPSPDLAGVRVLISAGGTREPIDPVRFIGNRSTGLQGLALAAMAAGRGARVTLVSANVELAEPAGVDVVRVGTAAELDAAMHAAAPEADVIIMAAAVADFSPVDVAEHKLKKDAAPDVIALRRNRDVLASLASGRRAGQVIVGFAAETGDAEAGVLEHARRKLAAKGCDLLVVNDVSGSEGFGSATNTVTILAANGSQQAYQSMSKQAVADAVLDAVAEQLRALH